MKNLKSILAIITVITMFSSCSKEEVNLYYPTDGLVSYFPFEGNLKDAHGDTPEGTKSDFGVIFDNGRVGHGVRFDGTSGVIEFDRTSFSTGNSASISVWIKSVDEERYGTIITSSDFDIWVDNNIDGIACTIRGNSTGWDVWTDFFSNIWMHYVATWDGNNLNIYLNDALVHSTELSLTLGLSDKPLVLSQYSNWIGTMDELLIYDKALSQQEVTQLFDR